MGVFTPPVYIEYILRTLTESGYDAFLVGGCVRDSVMGRTAHDWDVATSASPSGVSSVFEKTVLSGEKYGTVIVILPEGTAEVTTFRAESGYSDGRRPGSVTFVKSLDEDLSRRDFTMNAIAASLSGELTDPFGGFADINDRLIRCVGDPGERFGEDALRMFRAFRFRAELGFTIEEGTLASIYENSGRAGLISAERVRVELERTLLSAMPEVTGDILEAGLLAGYLPFPVSAPPGLERIAALPEESGLRWCAFCALLIDRGLIEDAGLLLRKLRLDAKTIKTCSSALSIADFPDHSFWRSAADPAHCDGSVICGGRSKLSLRDDDPLRTEQIQRIKIKRLLAKFGTQAVRCAAAASDTLRGAPDTGCPAQSSGAEVSELVFDCPALETVDRIIGNGECFSLRTLAVSGSDLILSGRPPGRGIGETLAALLDHVIERPEDNVRGVLLKIVEESGKT